MSLRSYWRPPLLLLLTARLVQGFGGGNSFAKGRVTCD